MTKFKKDPKFGGFVKPLTEVLDKAKKKENSKIEMAKVMFEYEEKNLETHFDSMIQRAERLTEDLKWLKKYYDDEKKEGKSNFAKGCVDRFMSAVNTFQNSFCNLNFQSKADQAVAYIKAKTILDFLSGKEKW